MEKLDAPMSEPAAKEWLQASGFRQVPSSPGLERYVKGGLWVRDLEVTPATQALLAATLKGLTEVKDEHMPTTSVVECGFIKIIGFEGLEDGSVNTHLFMRFTIDECPAGKRLAAKSEAKAVEAGATPGAVRVNSATVHHGGRKWEQGDASPRVQQMLQILTGSGGAVSGSAVSGSTA